MCLTLFQVHIRRQVNRCPGLACRVDGGEGDNAERALRAVRMPQVLFVHRRQADVQQGGQLWSGRQERRDPL